MNIGTDIVKNERLSKLEDTSYLSDWEINKSNSIQDETQKLAFKAGRWAAKEAVIKATNKEYSIRQIEVRNDENGAPKVFIEGSERQDILVSISHESDYSIAFSIAK